jgi:hypothetical protein
LLFIAQATGTKKDPNMRLSLLVIELYLVLKTDLERRIILLIILRDGKRGSVLSLFTN